MGAWIFAHFWLESNNWSNRTQGAVSGFKILEKLLEDKCIMTELTLFLGLFPAKGNIVNQFYETGT